MYTPLNVVVDISHPVVMLLSLVSVFIGAMSSLVVNRRFVYLIYVDTALYVYAECGIALFIVSVCCWERYVSQVNAWNHTFHNIMRLLIQIFFSIILS